MVQYRITDGIGTPDPNPIHLVNWCLLNLSSGALIGVGVVGYRSEAGGCTRR